MSIMSHTLLAASALATASLLAGCASTKQPVTIQPQANQQQGLIITAGPCPAGTSEKYQLVTTQTYRFSNDPYTLSACG